MLFSYSLMNFMIGFGIPSETRWMVNRYVPVLWQPSDASIVSLNTTCKDDKKSQIIK